MNECIFYFDTYRVDPRSLTIFSSDDEQQLEFRHMQLLCLLAENEKVLLTREQISEVLWPKSVVGSDNITSAIFALRSALGDDAKSPKYIQTVPKKGYRFLPEVRFQSANSGRQATSEEVYWKNLKPWCSTGFITKSIFALTFFVLCGISIFHNNQGNVPSTLKPLPENLVVRALQPVTHQDGAEVHLAVNTPDNHLAYIHKQYGRFDVYTKHAEQDRPLRWTEDGHRKRSLQWLNDSALIFIRCIYTSRRECQIVSRDRLGSETIWYSTSRRLRYLRPASPEKNRWLFVELKNHERNELKEIELLTGEVKNWKESYSKLSNKIAFPFYEHKTESLIYVTEEKGKSYLQLLNTADGTETTLNQSFEHIQFFTGLDAERGIVAGRNDGRNGIWLIKYAGQSLNLLVPTVTDEFINSVHLDLTQNILYYSSVTSNLDIVEYDEFGQVSKNTNGINSSHEDYYPAADPLSDAIYFVSNRSGSTELWRFDSKGKQVEKLTQLNASFFTRPLISPNGRYVAFVAKTFEYELIVLDLHDHSIQNENISKVQSVLSWSNDGRSIYTTEYDSRGKTRRYRSRDLFEEEVYDFATPLYSESQTGKRTYRIDWRENTLIYKNGDDGSEQQILNPAYALKRLRPEKIQLAGDDLYIAQKDPSNTKESLFKYSLATEGQEQSNTPNLLIDLPTGVFVNHISDDGKSVLAVDKNRAFGDIVKVELD